MSDHRAGFYDSTYQLYGGQRTPGYKPRRYAKKPPNLIVRLLMVAAIIMGFLTGCNDKGQPCDQPGSTRVNAQTHQTLHCKYDPTNGGNTWQKLGR